MADNNTSAEENDFNLFVVVKQWVDEVGGIETLEKTLLRRKKTQEVPKFIPPEVNYHLHASQ